MLQEIGKFDQKTIVTQNGMEKYIAFMLGKNLVFVDSIPFMNLSAYNKSLVKNC